jgi:hypothetical protein
MRKMFLAFLIVVVVFASAAQSYANPILSEVINIYGQDGWQPLGDPSGSLGPVAVYLPAGTYTATPVEPPFPGAIYTAYSYFSYGGEWDSEFYAWLASDPTNYLIIPASNGLPWISSVSPSDAFQLAVVWGGGSFTLTDPQVVDFSVGDSNYPDNTGGVSVELVGSAATPELSSLTLLGIGVAGLAGLTCMRQRLT